MSVAAALPVGFYADAEADMRVHGLNPAAVAAAAADAEWAAFEAFASTVAADAAAGEADEEARYSERAALAAAENALYRGRVDVARFVRNKLRAGGASAALSSATTAEGDNNGDAGGSAVEEELLGPVTFLSAAATGSAIDHSDVAAAFAARLAATSGLPPARDATLSTDDERSARAPPAKRQRKGSDNGTDGSDSDGPDLLDWRRRAVA